MSNQILRRSAVAIALVALATATGCAADQPAALPGDASPVGTPLPVADQPSGTARDPSTTQTDTTPTQPVEPTKQTDPPATTDPPESFSYQRSSCQDPDNDDAESLTTMVPDGWEMTQNTSELCVFEDPARRYELTVEISPRDGGTLAAIEHRRETMRGMDGYHEVIFSPHSGDWPGGGTDVVSWEYRYTDEDGTAWQVALEAYLGSVISYAAPAQDFAETQTVFHTAVQNAMPAG